MAFHELADDGEPYARGLTPLTGSALLYPPAGSDCDGGAISGDEVVAVIRTAFAYSDLENSDDCDESMVQNILCRLAEVGHIAQSFRMHCERSEVLP